MPFCTQTSFSQSMTTTLKSCEENTRVSDESKYSFGALSMLSVSHLVYFFNAFEPASGEKAPEEVEGSEENLAKSDETGPTRNPEEVEPNQDSKEPEQEEIETEEEATDPSTAPEPLQVEKFSPQSHQGSSDESPVFSTRSTESVFPKPLCSIFRPREIKAGPIAVNLREAPEKPRQEKKYGTILVFGSNRSINKESWLKRATSMRFPTWSKKPKEETNVPPLKLTKPTTLPAATKGLDSYFAQEKKTESANMENNVFLPRTHNPRLQDFPSVEDVEDIADARVEYSTLPVEWNSYMDKDLKSTASVHSKVRIWNSWFAPVQALKVKMKSSLASGKRRSLALKVRFFSPAVLPDNVGTIKSTQEEVVQKCIA